MGQVRLLGFTTLSCGCLAGDYRELLTGRVLTYIEEKGHQCTDRHHRRNHPVHEPERFGTRRGQATAGV